MSTQRSIRFPPDIARHIQAEADRLGRSFSWVVVALCGDGLSERTADAAPTPQPAAPVSTLQRGSPSPALLRFGADR